ncbi:hypothetical protein [Terrisporobacter glycolicus]
MYKKTTILIDIITLIKNCQYIIDNKIKGDSLSSMDYEEFEHVA